MRKVELEGLGCFASVFGAILAAIVGGIIGHTHESPPGGFVDLHGLITVFGAGVGFIIGAVVGPLIVGAVRGVRALWRRSRGL